MIPADILEAISALASNRQDEQAMRTIGNALCAGSDLPRDVRVAILQEVMRRLDVTIEQITRHLDEEIKRELQEERSRVILDAYRHCDGPKPGGD